MRLYNSATKIIRMKTIIILLITVQALHAQVFKAAVAKTDITPDTPQQLRGYEARKSTGIHDRIHHRVIVLDDGKTRFVLVSSDICSISPSEYEKVAEMRIHPSKYIFLGNGVLSIFAA